MPEPKRSITAAARALQSAANRLALARRHMDRDRILAGVYGDKSKGAAARSRLEAQAPALAALEAEVSGLRDELGAMLDGILPEPPDLPELMIEPPPKRIKRK